MAKKVKGLGIKVAIKPVKVVPSLPTPPVMKKRTLKMKPKF